MDDGGPTASILLFLLLIGLDMLFYGFSAALRGLNNKEILIRAVENNDKKAFRLNRIIQNPSRYVNTVQMSVTFINLVMGGFYLVGWLRYIRKFLEARAAREWASFLSPGAAGVIALCVTVFVLMYILLTVGVLIPKKLGNRNPEKWAYRLINPVWFVMGLLSPLTGLVSVTTTGILRLFGMKADQDIVDVTEEEIISMVNEGHEQGVIQASEAEMITKIFDYSDKEAQDIMTHRTNISAINAETPFREAVRFMLEEHNSRFPVYEENIDHIIGVLHLKDACRLDREQPDLDLPVKDIQGLLREAKFIPETRKIDVLFRTMQSTKLQMVIVVDEYGQTSGLVTMEDILEEIVGNITDEYDEDEAYIQENGNDEYVIDAKTRLEDLEERLDIDFEEEEFETLNGFLISKMDKIPEPGDDFDIDVEGYNFKVISVENKRVGSVLVTKLPERQENMPQQEEKE